MEFAEDGEENVAAGSFVRRRALPGTVVDTAETSFGLLSLTFCETKLSSKSRGAGR